MATSTNTDFIRPPKLKPIKAWLGAGLVISILGMALAAHSAVGYWRFRQNALVGPSPCNVASWLNCDAATGSSIAHVAGLPLGWWGLLYYLASAALLFLAWSNLSRKFADAARRMLPLSVLPALAVTIWLAVYSWTKLGSFCPQCLAMYVCNLALVVVACVIWKRKRVRESTPAHLVVVAFAVAALAAGGWVGGKLLQRRMVTKAPVDIQASVQAHFKSAPRPMLPPASAPLRGNPKGRLQILVFGDFQCGACKLLAFTLPNLLKEYGDEAAVRFIHFPLDGSVNPYNSLPEHTIAGQLALFSIAVQEKGKFWELHDKLYEKQAGLTMEEVRQISWEIGVEAKSLDNSDTILRARAALQQHIEFAHQAGVSSTPAIFLNGRPLQFYYDTRVMHAIFKMALQKTTYIPK